MRDLRTLSRSQVLVSPSLLAADFGRAAEQVAEAAAAGADMLHLDVMDGHLVPNLSFGGPVIKSLRKSSDLLFDVHLMITDPLKYAESFVKAGADHITFHVECDNDPAAVIAECRRLGVTVGMSLRPGTPASAILPYLDRIDLVLVMTVEPGFGGQSFMADQMPKVAEFKREIRKRGLNVRLEVDGGVDERTVTTCAAHGADLVVAGTAVFGHKEGMQVAISRLHAATPSLDSAL